MSYPTFEVEYPVERLAVLATEIKEKLALARRHGEATLAALMDAGDRLTEAKKSLDHGQWDDWLSENFALSDRTARLYMQLASHRARVEAKMATVASLGIRGALEQIYEDQIQEGKEKRNRELLALGPKPKPAKPEWVVSSGPSSYPRLPPSEMHTALTAVRLTIERWREWIDRRGLLDQFDAELKQTLEIMLKKAKKDPP